MKGTIQFRNTRVVNVSTGNEKTGVCCWVDFKADLSRVVCEEMGWDILEHTEDDGKKKISEIKVISGIGKKVPLLGEINAESAKLTPNGLLANQAIEFLAIRAQSFNVVLKGGGEDPDDPPAEAEVRFSLLIAIEAAERLVAYHRLLKDEPAVLKIKVSKEAQMRLGEDAGEGEDAEPEEETPEEGPALASAREVRASVRKG